MSTKTATVHYPGQISLGIRDVNYPGCAVKWFWTVRGYQKFFAEDEDKPGHGFLVVDARPSPYFFGLLLGVMVTYTKQLTHEEEADMQFVTREIDASLAKRRQERAERQDEERRVQEAATQEQARLALVGKKYEDRVKHMKAPMTIKDRNDAEAALNSGDPEVLFGSKMEAFQAGFAKGVQSVVGVK